MQDSTTQDVPLPSRERAEFTSELQNLVEKAAALLPSQGPLTAFVFLNTLQAFEDLPFEEGIQKGAQLFGCQPYLSEDSYRDKLVQDRICLQDLSLALRRDLKDRADHLVGSLISRHQLQLAMLQFPLRTGPTEELQWFVAETDALTKIRADVAPIVRDRFLIETKHWVMRDLRTKPNGHFVSAGSTQHPLSILELIDRFGRSKIELWSPAVWEKFSLQALWRVCRNGIHGVSPSAEPLPQIIRHRDILLRATGFDSDQWVHPVLIRFCAAYADQGLANWSLPGRDEGLFKAFLSLYQQSSGPSEEWMLPLRDELLRIERAKLSPEESLVESLDLLGVPRTEWQDFITSSLLALRGWAGLIWQLEVRPDRQVRSTKPGSLLEFLAVRLILERLALADAAKQQLKFCGTLSDFRSVIGSGLSKFAKKTVEQRAFLIFQLAQVLGWSSARLSRLSPDDWSELIVEIEQFTSTERRRLFHQAYERHFKAQSLDALTVFCQQPPPAQTSVTFQSVHCIDTREESFRRHLEEIWPEAETFGAVGFFGIPMYYKGVADAHFSALCPIVVQPRHWVTEEVDPKLSAENVRRAQTRRIFGTASLNVHLGSRGIAGGALLTTSLGVLASVPLVARVLFPRLTSRIRQRAGRLVQPPQITRLLLERKTELPGSAGDAVGFTIEEMATMAERLLRDIGLTSGFARLVAFFGHGSSCLNNPHKSCYDCGACSGSSGAPNARALTVMLNDRRIRDLIRSRGIEIPDDVHFLGGAHNTCTDSVVFFDVDQIPSSHRDDFEFAKAKLEEASERNAHERCRRFQSAPLNLTFAGARYHAEERSEDLAQTRPEYGNASNALCFVGRRSRVRGLYLDRRCFLHSYDPTADDERHSILGCILNAVVPVCSGINLQYFFSAIDSAGWGCGTKLPHNITSLMGVMDGSNSDLRSGLPWQGVEIHEPMRLLLVVEATPDGIRQVMERSEVVRNVIKNAWIQLALIAADSNKILVYREDEFHDYEPSTTELPQAQSSVDWYRGWREHLGFARIEA